MAGRKDRNAMAWSIFLGIRFRIALGLNSREHFIKLGMGGTPHSGRALSSASYYSMTSNLKTTVKPEKKRILAVDDRSSITRLVKLYLEQTNDYVVREENDAKAALSAAEEFQPHLILLDVMMPGMDGGELAARFQASSKLKAVPIVFLTAAITKAEVKASDGQLRGGYPFLAKPVVLKEMLACLKHHLGE
jgi:CheY-like chemotaxis protein